MLLALGLVTTLCAPLQDPAPVERPPNVVLFYIDDFGWSDAGFQGSRFYETPRMDRLAADGMVFTQAYANAPNCAPSRACLMTGLYPPRHGIYTVSPSTRGKARDRKLVPIATERVLADRFTTVAEVLQSAGYDTASIGKWHLGPDPTTQGFALNVAGNQSGSPRGGYFSPYKNPQLASGPEGEYLTDRLTTEALEFIRKPREAPFFLYMTHYAVHTPIQSKAEWTQHFAEKRPFQGQGNAKYAGMIASTDESLGAILDQLEQSGLSENTIVILFSDNGGHGRVTSNAPLRGAKGMLYEGGIRVPLVIRWPGRIAAGSRCDTPVIGSDLFPSLLDLGAIEPRETLELDGVSLRPLLEQTGEWSSRAIHWHFPAYLEAGGSRAKGGTLWRTTPAAAIRRGNHKLIEFFEDGRLELYDLGKDLSERHDLAAESPELVRELHAEMKAWRTRVSAPVPSELNADYQPSAVIEGETTKEQGER